MNLATTATFVATILLLPLATGAVEFDERALEEVVLPQGGVMEPTLESIQANLFTPGCALSFCHGAAMSATLDLRADSSFASLVDVPAAQFPTWDRIEPFEPDISFLICKLDSCPSIVGQRMPLIGGPLDESVIEVIREWVRRGAPEFSDVAVESITWGKIKAIYK